jgi:PPOX class probable F420-dependent enzyme
VTTPLDVLGAAHYVLLTTYRKDGSAVPTPVWIVRVGDELRVWTIRDTGKVKRIRRSGRVQVAPCSLRGEPRGESIEATARIMPDSEARTVLNALAAKYGVMGWWTRMMSRFTRGRAVIGITVP